MSGQNLSGKQFEQLPMFMQAKELHSEKIEKGDQFDGESHGQLMRTKLNETYESGLLHDVKQHGVQEPVDLVVGEGRKVLMEGHHRVAAANRVNPESWVPVTHYTTPEWMEHLNKKAHNWNRIAAW